MTFDLDRIEEAARRCVEAGDGQGPSSAQVVEREMIRTRWSTNYDRGASDYTDAGCRLLAEHAFRDIAFLLSSTTPPEVAPISVFELLALVEVVKAARAYRVWEEVADATGEWEHAREGAVALDAALEAFGDAQSASGGGKTA